MLKEKLPPIKGASNFEDDLFASLEKSFIAVCKTLSADQITLFFQSRKNMNEMMGQETFAVIKDRTVRPTFLSTKQRDMVLAFIDSQTPNLTFLDFDIQCLSINRYVSVDCFAQHKVTQKYFLFEFLYFDPFEADGEVVPGVKNTEINVLSLRLNIGRNIILSRTQMDIQNMAIISFPTSASAFVITKVPVTDVNGYMRDKESPTVLKTVNSVQDIFGNNF